MLRSLQITAVRVAGALGISLYQYRNVNVFIIGVITTECKPAVLRLTLSTHLVQAEMFAVGYEAGSVFHDVVPSILTMIFKLSFEVLRFWSGS